MIYTINIAPKKEWIAQAFNISNISHFKNEKEILFQPFCFFKIINVQTDLQNNRCSISLDLIGKKEIWEKKLNNCSAIKYQKSDNFMELK